jgi:hypothetical protein
VLAVEGDVMRKSERSPVRPSNRDTLSFTVFAVHTSLPSNVIAVGFDWYASAKSSRVPLTASMRETVFIVWLAVQMLVPSTAIPMGSALSCSVNRRCWPEISSMVVTSSVPRLAT